MPLAPSWELRGRGIGDNRSCRLSKAWLHGNSRMDCVAARREGLGGSWLGLGRSRLGLGGSRLGLGGSRLGLGGFWLELWGSVLHCQRLVGEGHRTMVCVPAVFKD